MADEIEFGTGGWRAIIADTFTRLNVERVAQALADRIHDENQVYTTKIRNIALSSSDTTSASFPQNSLGGQRRYSPVTTSS